MDNCIDNVRVAFDLYGTLVLPPPKRDWDSQMRSCLRRICSKAGPEVLQLAITGFSLAQVAAEMGVPLDQARRCYLTARFDSAEAFAEELASRFNETSPVSAETLSDAHALEQFILDHVTLAPLVDEVLSELVEQGATLQLISDVSSALSQPVQTRGLSKWFPEPLFSWQNGRLKAHGEAFKGLGNARQRQGWHFVGDNWRSDVLGGLAAGVIPIFLDPTRKNAARQLLIDIRSLFVISGADTSVRVDPLIRAKLPDILGIGADEIEAHPADYLRTCKKTGAVLFANFAAVKSIDSIRGLRGLLA